MTSVVATIAGKQIKFPKLTHGERLDIAAVAFERARNALLADLREAKADPAMMTAELAKLRQTEGTYELLLKFVKTPAGSAEIIAKSVTKLTADIPARADWENAPLNTLFVIAARLVGFSAGDDSEVTDSDTDGFDYDKDRPTERAAD